MPAQVEGADPVKIDQAPLGVAGLQAQSFRSYLWAAALAIVVWVGLAWLGTGIYVDWQGERSLVEANRKIESDIQEIASGLQRNLAVLHGIPAAIGRDAAVQQALIAYPSNGVPSPLSLEQRRTNWSRDAGLGGLNRSLAASVKDIRALSAIWVMNTAGDCIAASNAGSAGSFIGVNYADREYFKVARAGHFGQQFAVGRATGIPGLFFSAPVFAGDRFLGVVGGKIDLSYIGSWVNQANAFITDAYGVIILAQDKTLEMKALPDASVYTLGAQERIARYLRDRIPSLSIAAWGNANYPSLRKLNNRDVPLLLDSRPIPEEGLTVTVLQTVPSLATLFDERIALFLLSALAGMSLLIAITGTTYYVNGIQRLRRYREHQAHIEFLATHDALTGLFSRAVIDQMIAQGIALAARTGRRMGVLFMDLDRFKDINDSMGHEVGDQILREVADRLRSSVRSSDPVIRHGGDEFVVLLNDIDKPEDTARMARKILGSLNEAFVLKGVSWNLSGSMGIALYPDDGDTASVLLREADAALYRAKESGRADFCFFHASMHADALARMSLENELREALNQRQFVLYYQPQYSMSAQRVIGCEALVRWQHPTRGLVAPDLFIPAAERSGLIVALGEWVLAEACRQAQLWRMEGLSDFPIAVNLSAIQFRKPGLVQSVQHALATSGLPATGLELELTEGVVMEDTEHTMQTLQSLKNLGVHLAIDDFGTGYSSLAYLKRFDADLMKIDRSFVREIETDQNDLAIVVAIINLARSLDYRVIAEGVETKSQMELLEKLGCGEIQGYWFCRPIPAEACGNFLRGRQLLKQA